MGTKRAGALRVDLQFGKIVNRGDEMEPVFAFFSPGPMELLISRLQKVKTNAEFLLAMAID